MTGARARQVGSAAVSAVASPLASALLVIGCARAPAPAAPVVAAPSTPSQPDLVVIAVAGLRADPASHAGDRFLDAFRAGTPTASFTNAYAVSPSSYVSLATVLSGRYPSATPVCGLTGALGEEPGDTAPWCNHWPKDVPSLPGVLGLYGYRTALVTANVPGAHELGGQFQDTLVAQETWTDARTDWSALQARAKGWWEADATRPRLLVVVVSDLMILQRADLLAETGLDVLLQGGVPPRLDRNRINGVYARTAAELGQAGKALADALPSTRPRYTVALGLHGTNLGDAGVPWQALRANAWNDLLLERTLHVPLAIVGAFARQETQVVELIDLFPTFAALAGAVAPAGLPGQDLLATPFVDDPDATAYAEFGDMLSVRQGALSWSGRAFFYNRSSLDPELTNFFVGYKPDSNKFYLHDVTTDPFQERNLLEARPQDATRMNTLLLHLRTGVAAPPPSQMDAHRVWDLRMAPSQGYW